MYTLMFFVQEVKGGAARLEDIILSNITDLDVRNELLDSTMHEIRDEINIPESELGEPVLIGIAKNNTSSGRPSAEFFVKYVLYIVPISTDIIYSLNEKKIMLTKLSMCYH